MFFLLVLHGQRSAPVKVLSCGSTAETFLLCLFIFAIRFFQDRWMRSMWFFGGTSEYSSLSFSHVRFMGEVVMVGGEGGKCFDLNEILYPSSLSEKKSGKV